MPDAQTPKLAFQDRLLSLGLARVSEAAALASAHLIGRGDEKAADQAAVNAMREQLNLLDIKGVVVIGEGERDEAPMLYIGEEVGTGSGPAVDIALDPLEGTALTAMDMPNALTVIAMAPRGTLLHAPDVYMDKLAIGPGYAPGVVTLDMSPAERVRALARAKGCAADEITVCILDRERHHTMIADVRRTGAAIIERCSGLLNTMGLAPYTRTHIEVLGAESCYGPHARQQDTREAVLRVSATHVRKEALDLQRTRDVLCGSLNEIKCAECGNKSIPLIRVPR